jgi:hypothetical protein
LIMYLVWIQAARPMSGSAPITTSVIFQPLMNAITSPPPSVTRFCGQHRAPKKGVDHQRHLLDAEINEATSPPPCVTRFCGRAHTWQIHEAVHI